MTILSFVDTETTGLDPVRHEIWEVALIQYDPESKTILTEEEWQLPIYRLNDADVIALNINKFYDRYKLLSAGYPDPMSSIKDFCLDFVIKTRGTYLAGDVVSFDEERLNKLIRNHNFCPMWDYHLVDVEAVVAGALKMSPPWEAKDISEALGIPVPENQHEALADARWALDMYKAVME